MTMDLGLAGRTAIVSGSSKGIGRAVATALAAEGCNVCMTARGRDALDDAAGSVRALDRGRVVAVAADMTTEEGVERVVDTCRTELGPVDIAVTNVAGPKSLGFAATGDQAFVDAYRDMVLSVVWMVRRVLPDMRGSGWGRIVNIGSDCIKDVHREVPLLLANVNRAASVGLLKTLADELGPDGITVNNIAVGAILTENRITFHQRFAAEQGKDVADVQNANTEHIPVGRFGDPAELAAVVGFLCSDQAAFVTGETIAVNGGRSRTLF
ncbi:MAG: SDR family oxidoreductase [Ilumatobacteraceae bacterium]